MRLIKSKITGLSLVSLILVTYTVQAQNWSETFQQKKTQLSYLAQQIAALQLYIGYARQGFQIAGKGITLIKHLSSGEFDLHQQFISSHSMVNSAIARSPEAAEILIIYSAINQGIDTWKGTGLYVSELKQLRVVQQNLIRLNSQDLAELESVLNSAELSLQDQQRLSRIDAIAVRMQERYQFVSRYAAANQLLLRQRASEKSSISKQQKLFDYEK